MVPGGAGGDPCGKEGDEVVDGVGGERQRDRRHQVALNAAEPSNREINCDNKNYQLL